MACMDHQCLNPECREIWFDNDQNTPCPKGCEGFGCTNHFDEYPEYDDYDDEDYDDGEDW